MTNFNTPEWDKKFRSIFADIRQNRCVVFIGPEIVRIEDRPLRDVLREQLLASNAEDIVHYYDLDGFYLFRDKTAKRDVQREVALFYKDHLIGQSVDEAILLQIARLRMPLILSINPDSFLSDVAYRYSIKHRFAYFQHGGTAVQDVEIPTLEMPLFYNLCGALERDESLVLDYDDLFRLLSSLLGSPGLPSNLALTLRNAKHFLFIGFDFGKWYSQLLLRLLSGEEAIRKFAINPSKKNDNTTIFLVKQFGIEFIEDEREFLDELTRRAEQDGLFRDIVEAQTPDAVRVKHLLQNGNLFDALNHLKTNPKIENQVTMLLARYWDLQEREAHKTLDNRDYVVERNRIVDTILEILKTTN